MYDDIVTGTFLERPNRFIAYVEINGIVEKCHVKNTGRCKELLIKGVKVVLQKSSSTARKTRYDLISVYKRDKLINIDSQVPNAIVAENLHDLGIFNNITLIKKEKNYKSSRFDFYVEADGKKIYIEVKGVTLEKENVVLFPDAPTERGVKHIMELIDCLQEGYESYLIFIVQMKGADYVMPNYEIHAEFGAALKLAASKGVHILAYDCFVSENSISIGTEIDVCF